MPRAVPLTAEQWRDRRAQQRAADEAEGILRRPPGRLPANHHWDPQSGVVLDESAAASGSSVAIAEADVPFDDALFAWAVQHAPPRLSAHNENRAAWDAEREPWVLELMGKALPAYGEGGSNDARSTAWELALQRHAKAVAAHGRRATRVRVSAAQQLRRQRNEVHDALWRAQRYFVLRMPRDRRYAHETEAQLLLATAEAAVVRHRLGGYDATTQDAVAAFTLLNDVQRFGFGYVAHVVGACAKELTEAAAQAHWAAHNAPDGSTLWWLGMRLAGEHALAELRKAGGNGLADWGPICDVSSAQWRALPLTQQIARHKLEYVLDQEQVRLLRMAPPPRLLRWVRASLAQPLPPPSAPEPENPLDSDDDEFADVDEPGGGTWASGSWDELPAGSREAARLLGFNCVRWARSPRRVCTAWAALSADEHQAAAQLGVGETEWDMCLVQAAPRAAIVATALTQQWMDDYIAEAERLESRVRDVRANPRTNRATEPNVQSDDRKLRAHREVRLPGEGSSSASDRLQEFAQRSRAWVYYDIADAPPLLAADVTMADVPQLPASAAPMPTGRVTESGIVMMRLRDAMDAMDAMGSGGRSRGRGKGGGKGGNR